MAFHAEQKPLSILLSNNILGIPRNQRNYVWKKDNWQDLFSDINFVVKNGHEKNHFIGSMVLKQEDAINGLNNFTIIDGQQRIITIILFLSSIMKLFQERGMEEDFNGTIQYLISKDRKGQEYCSLSSESHIFINDFVTKIVKYENTQDINVLIKICTLNKIKESSIVNCIRFFYDSLKSILEQIEDANQYLISIRDAILDTNCVRITADTEEDSYTIFEILNARGQSLAEHELLKNYIMRYILPKNEVDVIKKKWEQIENDLGSSINRFFKHYTTHKAQMSAKEQIYKTIQKVFPKEKVSELMEDIMLKSRYYQIILNPNKDECSDTEYTVLRFLKDKRAEQFRPILLSLMKKKDDKLINQLKYEETLQFLYSFFICYNVIGEEKSNKLEDVIYKYAPILENKYSEEELENFINSIKKKIPTLQIFIERLKVVGWSNHHDFYKTSKNKERVRIILELIEKHLSKRNELENVSLEHVFPDSNNASNALIGNIILLETNINNNCKDKELKEKMQLYKNSNFKMARNFTERYNNVIEFIPEVRAESIAKMIYSDILNLV